MTKPFKLTATPALQFLFLYANADAFYISARRALLYNWVSVGCSNAHQSFELYIKAALKRVHIDAKKWHDLVKLLKFYRDKDAYFSVILEDSRKVEFLNELSSGYS